MNESEAEISTASTDGSPATYSAGYLNFVLGMLILVSIFNFIDRQILSILLEPIKAEFALSDTQLGLLTGLAFALFYSIMGIPLAKMADSGNRVNLICAVMILWSFMTAMCGLAVGFVSLLIARMGVAVGEAGSAPSCQSLIADYFPPKRRATMLGLHATGVYIGILLGFLLGGWINQFFGWRTAFFVVGTPGILFAIFFRFVIKEPPRGYSEGVVDKGKAPPFMETFRYLWAIRSYRHLPFAAGFYAFVAYGSMVWAPSFFIRTHGLSTGEVGTWLALSAGFAGGIGCYLGGVVSDRIVNKTGDKRWYMWLPACTIAISLPFILGIYLWPSPTPALSMSVVAWFLGNTWLGPTFAMIQSLAPLRMRALAFAIMLFIHNLIGLGLGPQLVGIISDFLESNLAEESLRYSLVVTLLLASILSAFHFVMAARTLREDLQGN